jgi:hypothetical protein
VVTLDRDIREDDAESTLAAIRQIRGVINVSPAVADVQAHMAYARARDEVAVRLTAFIGELYDPNNVKPGGV